MRFHTDTPHCHNHILGAQLPLQKHLKFSTRGLVLLTCISPGAPQPLPPPAQVSSGQNGRPGRLPTLGSTLCFPSPGPRLARLHLPSSWSRRLPMDVARHPARS